MLAVGWRTWRVRVAGRVQVPGLKSRDQLLHLVIGLLPPCSIFPTFVRKQFDLLLNGHLERVHVARGGTPCGA